MKLGRGKSKKGSVNRSMVESKLKNSVNRMAGGPRRCQWDGTRTQSEEGGGKSGRVAQLQTQHSEMNYE